MITNEQEYNLSLSEITNANRPSFLPLRVPKDEPIYEINLNTRTVAAPKFLSVRKDHRSETIYFIVDRYYDNMDLATTTCIIQYLNKGYKSEDGTPDEGHFYLVPCYDLSYEPGKILIPWMIGGTTTAAAGDVQFSFKFFLLNEPNLKDENSNFIYSLNTMPATSKVLYGMNDILENKEDVYIPATDVEVLFSRIDEINRTKGVYWINV